MGTEFRLYGRLNCNFFDLVSGKKEPQQTKGLGLLLSKSPKALELFLRLVFPGQHIKKLLELRCIVDCEAIQKENTSTAADVESEEAKVKKNAKSKRADIVIRFYDGSTPHCAIVVEAKGWDKTAQEDQVTCQIINYCEKFKILREFTNKITAVTLTANRILSHQDKYEYVNSIVNITWLQLLDAFAEIKLPNNKFEGELIKNYCDYLLKIKSDMKFYEKEVLSIPAGQSIDKIENFGIYVCPNTKKYNKHKKRAMFFAFRKGKGGEMNDLYKVSEVVIMRFDNEGINALKSTNEDYAKRAEAYRDDSPEFDKTEEKWVLFLDKDKSIKLPKPCRPEQNPQGVVGYSLHEFFAEPNKDDIVILESRNGR